MSSQVLQKNLSKVLPNSTAVTIAEILLLFLVGMLAITLHAKLRLPMHLPGKHGILFMFFLISSYSFSRFRFATLITCLGASTLLMTGTLGVTDPFIAGAYISMGIFIDLMLNSSSKLIGKVWFISLVSGLGYAVIPVYRLIISALTGYIYPSLLTTFFYPFFTHFIFGATGGFLAALAAQQLSKKLN
jgi:hypothetical protein